MIDGHPLPGPADMHFPAVSRDVSIDNYVTAAMTRHLRLMLAGALLACALAAPPGAVSSRARDLGGRDAEAAEGGADGGGGVGRRRSVGLGELFNKADSNGDGCVSAAEFAAFERGATGAVAGPDASDSSRSVMKVRARTRARVRACVLA